MDINNRNSPIKLKTWETEMAHRDPKTKYDFTIVNIIFIFLNNN